MTTVNGKFAVDKMPHEETMSADVSKRNNKIICDDCGGTGQIESYSEGMACVRYCLTCNGTGYSSRRNK